MSKQSDYSFKRVMDANFNRSKEGLRVCEDVCRYVLDAKGSTRSYKAVRHQLTEIISGLNLTGLIRARNIAKDVGRGSTDAEFKRSGATPGRNKRSCKNIP